MEVRFSKLFEKDLKGISEKAIILKIEEIINQLRNANSLQDLNGIKKLKGYKDCFRLRVGSYRMGLLVDKDTVWIARLMLRKDIYKYFP